jgi:carbohydrate diacid regulator
MVLTNNAPSIAIQEHQPFVSIFTTPFERIATNIAERLAELLCTNIWVLDEQQAVLASKILLELGRDFDPTDRAARTHMLRVPVHRNEYSGTIIIDTPVNGEVISPRLAYSLIHMTIDHALSVDLSSRPGHRKKACIFQLLHGAAADDAMILREAKQLGLDLDTPRAVLLIDAKEYILRPCPPEQGELDQPRERRRKRTNLALRPLRAALQVRLVLAVVRCCGLWRPVEAFTMIASSLKLPVMGKG